MNTDLKILVIGLGSMGKRRTRNLQSLGFKNIYGFDLRTDRCTEAKEKYGITVFSNWEEAITITNYDAYIISVPPDVHHIYMQEAVEVGIPFFVEAGVLDKNYDDIIRLSKEKKIVAAPSATLYFHPAVKMIFKIVRDGVLGNISNVMYHSGQYLPDWHTYESVSDYYVSNPETGGAREITPFELTWLTKLFGFPETVNGVVRKSIHIEGAEKIDDTYQMLLDYKTYSMNVVIDVVSRFATRRLLINGDKKQLVWEWNENCVKIFHPEKKEWETLQYETKQAAAGYNKNIIEEMYADELVNFFNAVEGKEEFFNTLEYDLKVLRLLYAAEKSYREKEVVKFS